MKLSKNFFILLQNYHNNLEEPMTRSDLFVVVLIYWIYYLQEIGLKWGGYI